MDHLAVVVKIVWLCHQQVAAKRTRVDAAALLEPANEHRIPRIFAEAPHPGWSVNVSGHAAGLVDYLFVQLAEWLKGGFALPSFLRMLMRCIGCWRCVTDSEACAWLVCAVLLQHGARRDTALKTCLGVWTGRLRFTIGYLIEQISSAFSDRRNTGKLAQRHCCSSGMLMARSVSEITLPSWKEAPSGQRSSGRACRLAGPHGFRHDLGCFPPGQSVQSFRSGLHPALCLQEVRLSAFRALLADSLEVMVVRLRAGRIERGCLVSYRQARRPGQVVVPIPPRHPLSVYFRQGAPQKHA